MSDNIKILVATHKDYPMPADDVYLPVQVGCAVNGRIENAGGDEGASGKYIYDDSGDNISEQNPYYCELTALYWGWKNLECDYMGLAHYRRHFLPVSGDQLGKVISGQDLRELVDRLAKDGVYIILPNKRSYYIETLYSHYAHSHHEADLLVMTDVIHEFYLDYVGAYVEVLKRHSAHMFNMCIMRKDILDEYCAWMFEVLGRIEKSLDISKYTDFDKRVFGRLSELLLDVWITKHELKFYELPIFNLEGENWARKILKFVRRKFKSEHED